jgi:hypothetical protein
LEDVDIDPAGILELPGSVLAELADIEDDPGEVRVDIVAQVDDLGPGVLLRPGRERENEPRQERESEALARRFQFASIL